MKNIILFTVFITTLITLQACNQSGYGVFYTVRNETPLEDGDFENEISVDNFVATSTSYYLNSGAVFTRTIAEAENMNESWSRLGNAASGTNAVKLCIDLAVNDDHLYGVFMEDTGEDLVYSLEYYDGSGWNVPQLGVALAADADIVKIINLANYLYAIVLDGPNQYSLFVSVPGSAAGYDLSFTDTGSDFTNAIIDSDFYGGFYYFLTSQSVFIANNDTATAFTNYDKDSNTHAFTGMGVSLTGEVMVTALNDDLEGKLIRYNGSGWDLMADAHEDDILNDVQEISVDGTNIAIVASSDGYFEIDSAATDSSLITPGSVESITSKEAYASLELRLHNINMFYFEQGAGIEKLYALTNNDGMWRLILDPSNTDYYRSWTIE
jgi:hypothetical protein